MARWLTAAAVFAVGYYIWGGGSNPVGDALSNASAGYSGHGSGTMVVGRDIQPGRYRTRVASSGCYWARLGGLTGEMGDIHANENSNGPTIVDITTGDTAFQSRGCAPWTTDLSAITANPSAPFRDGTYLVGTDISAGTWRANNPGDCYWARLSGFGGGVNGVLANDNGSGVVTILPGDVGFKSERCGTWTKVD